MKKKKVLSILMAACIAGALTVGCGGQEEQQDGGEPASGGGTVSIMGWYDEDDMQGVIDAVNEQLGGDYTLEYTYVSLSDYNNVLGTQLASGEGPDIIMDGAQFPARVKAGNLEEITDKDYVGEFSEEGLALSTQDGKVYGIPTYGWFSGIWYNADILNECGVEVPHTLMNLWQRVKRSRQQDISLWDSDLQTAIPAGRHYRDILRIHSTTTMTAIRTERNLTRSLLQGKRHWTAIIMIRLQSGIL